ncbi:MAG: SAM-dependent methyltransferase, partial [Gemmatimonadaceae bacterium]|nr:SAM-dependent methyltransferase [Acetobacteraceae bacterium]
GGLTLSQAEFDHHAKSGMPQSAASGGSVDYVLAAEDMAAALLNYCNHRTIFEASFDPDGLSHELPGFLATICAVLHARLGRDFRHYKTGTLLRRVQRRMHVLQTAEVPAYINQLRTLPNEAELLFRELLISVTRFFRDPNAFDALRTLVISPLLANPGRTEGVRVWIAGCATGEEAYTIAILLKEARDQSGGTCPIQVFATDIDDRAIEAARTGLYPDTIAADVSAERLERHFVKEGAHYRIAKSIRELCLFSVHDLSGDPPFARLDLVTCRNLMIYFETQLQQRVLSTFHYALGPQRHLFLGPSEGVTARPSLFAALDKSSRIFVRQDGAGVMPSIVLSRSPRAEAPVKRPAPDPSTEIDRRAARAIARYAPAFVVVDRHHDILRFSGQTARFLDPATGVASLNLFALLHVDLGAVVREALRQAASTGSRVVSENIAIETDGAYARVTIIVEPLPDTAEAGLFLVAFQDATSASTPPNTPSGSDDEAVRNLTLELSSTRERLRHATEALQASNEELQSS